MSDWVWGDGAARLFSILAARVQYACNNRNFANRTETGPSPLLPRQPNLRVTPSESRGSGGWVASVNSETMSCEEEEEGEERASRSITRDGHIHKLCRCLFAEIISPAQVPAHAHTATGLNVSRNAL